MLGKGAESLPLHPEGPRSGEGPRKAQLGWPEWGRAGGPHHLVLTGYTTAVGRHGPGGLSSLRDGQVPRPRANRGRLWSQAMPQASLRPEGGISPAAPRSWGSQGGLTRRGEGGAHCPHGPQKSPAVKSIHRSLGVQLPSPTITCRYLDLAGPARHAPKLGFWGEGGCSWLTAYI